MIKPNESDEKSVPLTYSFKIKNPPCVERLKKLEETTLIVFEQKTAEVVLSQIGSKQSNGMEFLYPSNLEYKKNSFYLREKPRKGQCVLSTNCIPNSKKKDFLEQTFILANYIETILPEIKATLFWKMASRSLTKIEKKIEILFSKNEYASAVDLLQKLQINQFFRPSFVEVFNQIIVHNNKNDNLLYSDDYTWTNSSITTASKSFLYTGYFNDEGLGIHDHLPDIYSDNLGVSFICQLDWLKTII